jgi:hypothetical protein
LNALVRLDNVTIADNSSAGVGGVFDISAASSMLASGGEERSLVFAPGLISTNSIIADNSAASTGSDCDGTIDSLGHTLVRNSSGCSGLISTDLTADPLLRQLAHNGTCPTETEVLLVGSPALEAGNPGKPNGGKGHCLAVDQCGRLRPEGKCDLGAFQVSS